MNAVVMQMFQPDIAAMTQHVEHLFGGFLDGYHEGKIELAWTDNKADEAGRYKLRHAAYFGTDELEQLVEKAAALNSVPMTNVYIGAALRHPDVAPFGRSKDEDAWALTALYVDLDDPGATTKAREIYAPAKPSMVVQTGREPHLRGQCWWRLSEPLTDVAKWPAALRGLAVALDGDTTVANPGRVMRLAGSIAWPVKEGRTAVELTCIRSLKEPGQPIYAIEHLTSLFPPVDEAAISDVDTSKVTVSVTNGLGLTKEKIADKRELYMRDTSCAILREYIGTYGAAPTAQELFDAAWPQYERETDLTRPGRGPKEFAEKCRYTLQRFERGEIRGMRTLDEAVASHQAKQKAKASAPVVAPIIPALEPAKGRFLFEKISDLRSLPPTEWLVDKWIPQGSVGILYGKWAAGKSFIGFDLGLHLAYAMPDWHGVSIPKHPVEVLVIAREGHAGFVKRIDAFKSHYGLGDDAKTVTFMRGSVSFMNDQDFSDLCAGIRACNTKFGLVIIDTVARVTAGQDTNEQKVATLFMERCQVIGELTGAAAIGVHHQNKAGTMMGSIYFEANADFVFEVTRDGEDGPLESGEIRCTKQKDGEDGWKLPVSYKKIVLSQVSQEGSLVVANIGGPSAAKPVPGLPDKDTCKRILNAINEAWIKGVPWSPHPNTEKLGRYAVYNICREYGLTRSQAETLVQEWQRNGLILVQMRDTHSRLSGLKVIQWL